MSSLATKISNLTSSTETTIDISSPGYREAFIGEEPATYAGTNLDWEEVLVTWGTPPKRLLPKVREVLVTLENNLENKPNALKDCVKAFHLLEQICPNVRLGITLGPRLTIAVWMVFA